MVILVFLWHFATTRTTHCNFKFWKIDPPYCIVTAKTDWHFNNKRSEDCFLMKILGSFFGVIELLYCMTVYSYACCFFHHIYWISIIRSGRVHPIGKNKNYSMKGFQKALSIEWLNFYFHHQDLPKFKVNFSFKSATPQDWRRTLFHRKNIILNCF